MPVGGYRYNFTLSLTSALTLNVTLRPLYPREKDPLPIVQKAGWASGPVRTDAENFAPTDLHRDVMFVAYRIKYSYFHSVFPC